MGAATQADALSGRLVAELAPSFRVSWTLLARIGATTAGATRYLARWAADVSAADGPPAFDVAVVSLGLNDVLARRPLAEWLADVDALATLLRSRFGVGHVLFSGLPPLHALPAFPQPLRWYLGAVARRYDRALARAAAGQPGGEHVPLAFPAAIAGLLAADGLHPGPPLYRRWATELARRILARDGGPTRAARAVPPPDPA